MLKFQEKVLFRKVPRLLSAPQIHSIYKFLKSWTIDIFFESLELNYWFVMFSTPKMRGGGGQEEDTLLEEKSLSPIGRSADPWVSGSQKLEFRWRFLCCFWI